MQRLRIQLDRIDLQLLKLLQQRTKLSRRIGETKRQHGAVIYVPGRERDILRRVDALSRGKMPARSVVAIYREILSSSRAAQGQGAIGLLQASAPAVLLPARWCFGASGEFRPMKNWREIGEALNSGALAFALMTGTDLFQLLGPGRARTGFLENFRVVRDFSPTLDQRCRFEDRIFIVTSRAIPPDPETTRLLVLIECKTKGDALKSWLNSMPEPSIHAEKQVVAQRGSSSTFALRLSSALPLPIPAIESALHQAQLPFSVLGIYGGSEDYAG